MMIQISMRLTDHFNPAVEVVFKHILIPRVSGQYPA